MLDQVRWRTELVLGGVSILIGLFVGLFIPETRGITLEQMTEVKSKITTTSPCDLQIAHT